MNKLVVYQLWLGCALLAGGIIGKLADDDLLVALIAVGAVLVFGALATNAVQKPDSSESAT